jgi:formate dehydrogenase major subunit
VYGSTLKQGDGFVRKHKTKQHLPRPRLTTPMVRVDGELVPATWDEALDRIAEGFLAAREDVAAGVHSFGMFSCSKSTNEMNYAAQKFSRVVMGSNDIDSCNRT